MRVGLTGGIASGKSAVAERLAARGATIIDADLLAREVVAPGTRGLAAVVERFGEGVLQPDGSLDRARLGDIVFADERARAALEAIVHPAVRTRAREIEEGAPAGTVVVHVIPLLVETGLQHDFDTVVVVDVPEDVQLARLIARNGLTKTQARQRLAAQSSRGERLAAADVVLDNSGPLAELDREVDLLWHRLRVVRGR